MNKRIGFVKTTIIGGLIFLLPFVIIISVLGKAIKTMLVVVRPIEKMLPLEKVAGIAVVNIVAVILIILLCFTAGLIARSAAARRLFDWLDSKLVMLLPGYSFIKGFSTTIKDDDTQRIMKPVLVRLDDQTLLGFEVERLSDGQVVVFFPGSPDTTSGSVAYMTDDRVEQVNIDFASTYKILRTLGRGSEKIIKNS